MKKFIQAWIGLSIFSLLIWTPIYIFIIDSGEDKVKKVSFSDVLFTERLIIGEGKQTKDEREKLIDEFSSSYNEKFGIDVTESIYEVLKKDSKVSNLEIKKVREFDQESIYVIVFERESKNFQLEISATDPSFFNPKWGPAIVLNRLNYVLGAVGPSYGIPKEHFIEIYTIFRSRLPD